MKRATLLPAATPWYRDGLRWECQGSGKCCVSHGQMGYVFLSLADRRRLAAYLELSTSQFTRKYCTKTDDQWHIRDEPGAADCRFLVGKRCGVYEARPTQCRTWPFWPEVMHAKAWQREVAAFCPGVGKGKLWTAEEIGAVLETQSRANQER